MYDLSIIILSHNRPKFLKETINSFINNKFPNEIITIQDNSNSQFKDQISNISKKYNINITFNNTNSLFENFNDAVRNSFSKYLIIFHDDDMIDIDFKNFYANLNLFEEYCNCICLNFNAQNFKDNLIFSKETWLSKEKILKLSKKELVIRYLDNDSGGVAPWSGYIYNLSKYKKIILNIMTKLDNKDAYFDTHLIINLLNYGEIYWINKVSYIIRLHSHSISYKTLISYKKFINYVYKFHNSINEKSILKYRYRNLLVLLSKKNKNYYLQIYFIIYLWFNSPVLRKKMNKKLLRFFKL
tara:strand:- start:3945 stop:4841 length:897 start_codon:yes stop_codon:yes gene_type:complete